MRGFISLIRATDEKTIYIAISHIQGFEAVTSGEAQTVIRCGDSKIFVADGVDEVIEKINNSERLIPDCGIRETK